MADAARVCLRAVQEQDLDYFRRWDRDPRVTRYAGTWLPPDQEPHQWLRDLRRDPRTMLFVIELPGGQPIGTIQLLDINWFKKAAELRISIGEPHLWGQGLGTEALGLLMRHLRERWGFRQLYLRVAADNLRARRAYAKCGFRVEGVLPAEPGQGRPRKVILMVLDLSALTARWVG